MCCVCPNLIVCVYIRIEKYEEYANAVMSTCTYVHTYIKPKIMPTCLFYRIGASFQEQYTHRNKKAGKYRNVCNSVFTGWDFNITQKQLASTRHKSIKRKLQVCA